MSELSRRDFLKAGATGLVLVTAGGLVIGSTKDANARMRIRALCDAPQPPSLDPPDEIQGGNQIYVICPSDDFEAGRNFCGIRRYRIDNNVEVDETTLPDSYDGTQFDPFDGTVFYDNLPTVTANTVYRYKAIIGCGQNNTIVVDQADITVKP